MTTHEQRVKDFERSHIIQKDGLRYLTSERFMFLVSQLREYIVELDLTLIEIDSLKAQLNSKQSKNDKEKEDSYND